MTPQEQLEQSTAAQGRHAMMATCGHRLQHLAYRALTVRKLAWDEFVVVCIAVDSRWRAIVEDLMPDHEAQWQERRDAGQQPVAMGIVFRNLSFVAAITRDCPELAAPLLVEPTPGSAHLIVLDDTGGTVYDILAKEDAPEAKHQVE